jgi:hypothetical protein
MPQVEFEPMIPVSERAKTVQASDLEATVIGKKKDYIILMISNLYFVSIIVFRKVRKIYLRVMKITVMLNR